MGPHDDFDFGPVKWGSLSWASPKSLIDGFWVKNHSIGGYGVWLKNDIANAERGHGGVARARNAEEVKSLITVFSTSGTSEENEDYIPALLALYKHFIQKTY